MTANVEQMQIEHVACEICLKEVPASESVVAEATDYVAFFCGLDCYGTWKAQRDKDGDKASLHLPGV